MTKPDSIFDKILRKEIPAEVVFENEHVLAFKDVNPQAPIHVLVIPKTKFLSFSDFKNAESGIVALYFKNIAQVAEKLGLEEGGYRVVFNHGKDGQQSVPYVHGHILGGRSLHWPPG